MNAQTIIAVRRGNAITRQTYQRDVASLAALLPAHKNVLNICADRYRFMVGLEAARRRGQVSLLPPSFAPGVLAALQADYPDLYVLTDGAKTGLPEFAYPETMAEGGALPAGREAGLVLFTSGSTGSPKPVPKSWLALHNSALAAGVRLEVGQLRNATLISTVPHQHSYGIESTILLGLLHGVAIDTGLPLYPSDIRAAIERAPGSKILVTTPVHLRALVAEPEGMPGVDLILSATAPLSQALAAGAESCFGAPLVEIYGCTEAGQVATRRSARETAWECLDGVELSQDQHGTWAQGAAVEGQALLHDDIELIGGSRFLLGARAADLVDVAGKRTSLSHLNHLLLSIEGVQDGVFLMGEADGARVARPMALVVAPALPAEAILKALRQRIDAAFLPRPLVLVEALPRNALGKLPREDLLRLAGRA
jgi:acyl-coenzyme A synthetase/AMP-(fatty) acid ligase